VKIKAIVGQDGSVRFEAAEGEFQAAGDTMRKLIADLEAAGLSGEWGSVEQHRHDGESAGAVHAH